MKHHAQVPTNTAPRVDRSDPAAGRPSARIRSFPRRRGGRMGRSRPAAGVSHIAVASEPAVGRRVGLLLGSVGQQCAAHARCPVVIVHPTAAPPSEARPDPSAGEGGPAGKLRGVRTVYTRRRGSWWAPRASSCTSRSRLAEVRKPRGDRQLLLSRVLRRSHERLGLGGDDRVDGVPPDRPSDCDLGDRILVGAWGHNQRPPSGKASARKLWTIGSLAARSTSRSTSGGAAHSNRSGLSTQHREGSSEAPSPPHWQGQTSEPPPALAAIPSGAEVKLTRLPLKIRVDRLPAVRAPIAGSLGAATDATA